MVDFSDLNTSFNRMAFRKPATCAGVAYQKGPPKNHHSLIREGIYTVAAALPFAIAKFTPDRNKRFMLMRTTALTEAAALLLLEVFWQHEKKTARVKQAAQGSERRFSQERPLPRLKPHYQAVVDAMEHGAPRGMRR